MLEAIASWLILDTKSTWEILDVTPQIRKAIQDSSVKTGLALISVPHTTAAIMINENDSRLLEDITSKLGELVPIKGKYKHNGEGNAYAHILNALLGSSACIPVENNKPALGNWQSILFIEMDGPKTRNVIIRIYH